MFHGQWNLYKLNYLIKRSLIIFYSIQESKLGIWFDTKKANIFCVMIIVMIVKRSL